MAYIHRYLIQQGVYELNATLKYSAPACFVGQGPSRSSVVIVPGSELLDGARLLQYNDTAVGASTLVIARLVVDGRHIGSGVKGQYVFLEDVTVKDCYYPDPNDQNNGGGLSVGAITAVNCSFTGNIAGRQGGAVFVAQRATQSNSATAIFKQVTLPGALGATSVHGVCVVGLRGTSEGLYGDFRGAWTGFRGT